jgi:outer membrane protein
MKKLLIPASVWLTLPIAVLGEGFQMTLQQAEERTMGSSQQLKALTATGQAAEERADAQFSALLPRLSVDGYYQYNTHITELNIPLAPAPIQLGDNESYAIGPALTYTLWDTGSARNLYRGALLQAEAKREEEKSGKRQIRLALRTAYLRLQLALEELRLLHSTLSLSQKQNRDIAVNFRAGAATKLDRVIAERELINYQLQFQQKQAEVSSDLKDLFALLSEPLPEKALRPGPPEVADVDFPITLDSLEETLKALEPKRVAAPTEEQPALKSQKLLAESFERMARGQSYARYPTLRFSASAKWQYPDQSNRETIEQNSFAVSLSMPLFEGGRQGHLAAEARKQAEAAQYNEAQVRTNLHRDYQKAVELLASLKEQRKLAALDVERSEDAAKLYYQSYRGGRLNLTDTQSAANRALVAKVNAARINAQILTQLYLLQSISGEE